MENRTQIILIVVIIIVVNAASFGQGFGGSQKSVEPPENFEMIECGFRFPFPGKFTLSTSVGYSPYQKLGEGKINRFEANMMTYDIGCIDLDDPPRKLKKAELISLLNSNTKTYLADSSEYISLPATTVGGREIYEFKTDTDYQRRIKYIFKGNRVSIFIVGANDAQGMEEGLKFIGAVEHFSVKETVEKTMESATQKTISQSPNIKLKQTDAAHKNIKGQVKSVRIEAEDVPILVGKAKRRIRSDETYDRYGNLLKNFWFQDAGYPTSVRFYGFVDGKRVSDSEDFGGGMGIGVAGSGKNDLPTPDPRYEYRYEYIFNDLNKVIEKKEYDNRGKLIRIYQFTYKADLMEEKRFDTDGKLISTKRRQFDKNGNEIKYEFWWYEQTDKEIENYTYKKFDKSGNWTERQVVKTIIERGLTRTRTSNEFQTITYYEK